MTQKMTAYVLLMRGINVGGKNRVAMATLRTFLERLGCEDVATYLQSGNALVRSGLGAAKLAKAVEDWLPGTFKLDSSLIKVLALPLKALEAIVEKRPKGFGDRPDTYHSDAIFMIDVNVAKAMTAFDPREGVDTIWPGDGVIYSQRLSAQRTKTRLNTMMASPLYKSMTIRSWGTTLAILDMLRAIDRGGKA